MRTPAPRSPTPLGCARGDGSVPSATRGAPAATPGAPARPAGFPGGRAGRAGRRMRSAAALPAGGRRGRAAVRERAAAAPSTNSGGEAARPASAPRPHTHTL